MAMYETPPTSLHMELARQRQREMVEDARRASLAGQVKSEVDSERMLAVKGVFAGIAAAVSGLTKPKPTPTHAAPSTGC
jgi:hypothetical protein